MDNKVFIDLITKNHGTDALSGTSYLIIIYDQDLNRITEQYPSTKDTLTEALDETFKRWKDNHQKSQVHIQDWDDFIYYKDTQALIIIASDYGVIFPVTNFPPLKY